MAKYVSFAGLDAKGRDNRRTELASKVMDALRDDAMKIAMDLGRQELIAADGVPKLVENIIVQVNEHQERAGSDGTLRGGRQS